MQDIYFIFLTNKTKTRTHTHTYTKKRQKKRKRDEITHSRPSPFSFWTEYQSIIWSMGCHFFNNLSLFELVDEVDGIQFDPSKLAYDNPDKGKMT